ncbi:MAG: restriction endonuclease subunit S [Methylococcaceae bacterium]|nr:restriction endonuclease subunit S [Methylococcaceae bacterium]
MIPKHLPTDIAAEWVPIDDVVDFQEGPGVRKYQYRESGVKLLNGSNINGNTLNLTNTERYISDDEAYGKYKHFLVDAGDLLIASSGIAVEKFHKKIAYAREEHLPLCMNTSTIRFKTKNDSVLNIDYFRRFLATNLFKKQLGRLITGSAQLNFGPSHLKQMFVPLPPLEEQKRIAEILDKADALRRKRQQAIDLTDQLLRSVFLDMFGDPVTNPKGWPIGKIGDLLFHVNYGTSAKAGGSGKYPILRMNNITYDGNWNLNSLKYIDMDEKDRKKYTAEQGDILFNRTNSKQLVGKTAVFEENKPYIFAGYLVRAKVNNLANPYYISAYMNSDYGKTILRHMCKSIVGMANINAKEFQSIKIPIPPIEEQEKYSRFLERTKKNICHYEKCMLDCNLLFNSLTQQAFRGELTKQSEVA